MLTADLVQGTRRGGELHVKPLSGKKRERALELAHHYCDIAKHQLGHSRDDLFAEWAAVPSAPSEKKLAAGLQKLIEDSCEFESETPVDPMQLRGEVFTLAAEAWRKVELGHPFDREHVLRAVGAPHQLSAHKVEQALYADLRAAQRLVHAPKHTPQALVERYDLAQAQAVLLRAVKVKATVRCSSADAYRALFRSLKFHRLLYRLSHQAEDSYSIEIDGPFSMFEHVTKYGLQLALVLPALQRADELQLEAEVRWGKSRQALTYRWHSKRDPQAAEADARLPDELIELVSTFRALDSGWQVAGASKLIDLPGVGLCVPDLIFTSPEGDPVHFELLGYWSREAVWKRVELARKTKHSHLLFAVSSRLRVSEKVLDEDDNAALYVFKGVMNAKAVLNKLESLVG